MIRASEQAIRRVREARVRPRETVRMDPLGSLAETLAGRVTDVHTVDVADRLGLESSSVGATLASRRFPGLRAVQITILVDEIDIDPSAEDLMSYTFWIQASRDAESVVRDDIIYVEIEPVEMLGAEARWVARRMEVM